LILLVLVQSLLPKDNMAKPDQEAQNADEIVQKINAGLGAREVDFSVDACLKIPIDRLAAGTTNLLSQSIVAEIFHETGLQRNQASRCWDEMVERIMLRKMLQMATLQQNFKWNPVIQRLDS
jgi:hypothetical protein